MTQRKAALRIFAVFAMGIVFGACVTLLVRERTSGMSDRGNAAIDPGVGEGVRAAFPDPNDETQEDLYQSLKEASRLEVSGMGFGELDSLVERWAVRSPAEMFLAFLEDSDLPEREKLLGRIVSIWAATDSQGALDAAQRVGDVELRSKLTGDALRGLAEVDPEKALDWLGEKLRPGGPVHYGEVFKQWAARDPEAAVSRLVSLTNSVLRRDAIGGIAAGMAMNDPGAAFAWANGLEDRAQRNEALARAVEVAATNDPASAAKGLLYLGEGEQKAKAAEALMGHWAEPDSEAAIAWARQNLEGPVQDMAIQSLAQALAPSHPETAVGLLEQVPGGPTRDKAMEAIVGEWAASDPGAVAEWLSGLEDKRDYYSAGSALAKNWIRNDPPEAIRYLESLDRESGFDRIASAAVAEWSMFQPDQAFRWAGSVYREEPLAHVDTALWLWAQTDFESAADYLLGATDVDVQRQFVSSLLTDYAEKYPAGAAFWVEQSVTDPSVRAAAIGHVASTWVSRDRAAASEWIGNLPEGQVRDSAVEALLLRTGSSNREEAVRWASTLSDGVRREAWLKKLSE